MLNYKIAVNANEIPRTIFNNLTPFIKQIKNNGVELTSFKDMRFDDGMCHKYIWLVGKGIYLIIESDEVALKPKYDFEVREIMKNINREIMINCTEIEDIIDVLGIKLPTEIDKLNIEIKKG